MLIDMAEIASAQIARAWLARVFATATLLLITSCAVLPVAYNNADLFVSYRVQEHFDLQGVQETDFSARLARFHKWHRIQELPHYEAFFHSVERRLSAGLTMDDINWASKTIRERYQVLVRHVAEEAAPVLVTLSPEQFTHLEAQFAEDNRKFVKKNLSGSDEKRLRMRTKWLRGQIEDWTGRLTPEQEARVAKTVKESPELAPLRLEDRKRNQQRFIALLHSHRKPAELTVALQDFLEHIETNREPAFAQAMRDIEPRLAQLLLDLDKTLTPAQRSRATARFASYAADFRVLAQKGQEPSPRRTAFTGDVESLTR